MKLNLAVLGIGVDRVEMPNPVKSGENRVKIIYSIKRGVERVEILPSIAYILDAIPESPLSKMCLMRETSDHLRRLETLDTSRKVYCVQSQYVAVEK